MTYWSLMAPPLLTEAQLRVVADPARSHYQTLGISVSEAPDPGKLSEARRRMAVLAHPDRWPAASAALGSLVHNAMARVNVAYEVLSDQKARARYDKTVLRKYFDPCVFCGGAGTTKKQKGFRGIELSACAACQGIGHTRKEP